jgi:hypothetical protein
VATPLFYTFHMRRNSYLKFARRLNSFWTGFPNLLFSSVPTPQLDLQLSRRRRKTSVIYFFPCGFQLGLDEATVSLLRLSF